MDRNDIYNFVGDKLNECFFEFLNGCSGDISIGDSIKLDTIQNEITDLIIRVVSYNSINNEDINK